MVDTWPINGDLLFHVGPCWKKRDHVPNPCEKNGCLRFGKGPTGPKGIWNLTYAFPLWSMSEKWGQVPKPFKIILILFILKGPSCSQMGLEPGLCFSTLVHDEKWDQVPNPLFNPFVFVHFWKGPNWSQRGLEPDLCSSTLVHVGQNGVKFQFFFEIMLVLFMLKGSNWYQRGLEFYLCFATLV